MEKVTNEDIRKLVALHEAMQAREALYKKELNTTPSFPQEFTDTAAYYEAVDALYAREKRLQHLLSQWKEAEREYGKVAVELSMRLKPDLFRFRIQVNGQEYRVRLLSDTRRFKITPILEEEERTA